MKKERGSVRSMFFYYLACFQKNIGLCSPTRLWLGNGCKHAMSCSWEEGDDDCDDTDDGKGKKDAAASFFIGFRFSSVF